MDEDQLAIASFVLSSIALTDLLYFLNLASRDQKFFTILNIQLLLMVIGCIGYVFCTGVIYYHRESSYFTYVLDAGASVKAAYNLSFLFLGIAESAYLYHSWLRAKTILFYNNKIWYTRLDNFLKVSMIIIFLPFLMQSLCFILNVRVLYDLAIFTIAFAGLLILVFDLFILYSFTNYFLTEAKHSKRYSIIAKYEIISSIGVLFTITSHTSAED